MKLDICIPPLHYKQNMRVVPAIGVPSYLGKFGHSVTWVIWPEDSNQVQPFAKVKQEMKNVKLLMVGGGSDQENLKRLAAKLGFMGDIIFTGYVSRLDVPDFITAGDIAVYPVPLTYSFELSSPIKLFEYMAMAKPMVANDEAPEHKTGLEESGRGIPAPFTTEAFADVVIGLLDDPDRATEVGNRGRKWVVENRSCEILAGQIEQGYFELVEGRTKR